MLMHSNIPDAQWNDVKGEIQKTWSKLNAAELEGTHGDVRAISSLVQKRYGLNSDVVDQKLDECIDRCGTAAGPATFRSPTASSAGPADLGSNVDPSSLSASINQTSSDVHSRSFEAPEEGMDSADSLHASWNEGGDRVPDDFDLSRDSRMAEDVTTNEPKRYGSSEGQFNESRSEAGQAGNSGRSETVSKSARNQEGSSVSRSQSRDRESDFAQNSRNSEDSSQEE